jgi:DNA (cytosine-5)-methyltransferase 1
MKLNVIGITSGIGSLQYGFKKSGFNVLHSHEWRKYYHDSKTYEANYLQENTEIYECLTNYKGVDCIVSHPECGNFSNLYTGKNRETRQSDPGDIYKFMELCRNYQPKTFLVDNLPKSLIAVTKEDWENYFPDYKFQIEMVSNWGYGNVQKNRNRLFIIGIHKDLDFKFVPNEFYHNKKTGDVLLDIEKNCNGHLKMPLDVIVDGWNKTWIDEDKNGPGKVTLGDMQNFFKRNGYQNFTYKNSKGEYKTRPGYSVLNMAKTCAVLSGGGASAFDNFYLFDEKDNYYRPLTIRERARIQGFKDDFILTPDGYDFYENKKKYQSLAKSTGKCMPVEFPQEFSRQLSDYLLNGVNQDFKPFRILKQPHKFKQLTLL